MNKTRLRYYDTVVGLLEILSALNFSETSRQEVGRPQSYAPNLPTTTTSITTMAHMFCIYIYTYLKISFVIHAVLFINYIHILKLLLPFTPCYLLII